MSGQALGAHACLQRQAEEISRRGGNDTVAEVTTSRPRFWAAFQWGRQSESEAARRRALMLPQEVQRLPADKLLVLRRRLSLLMLNRVVWFADPWFGGMAGEPPSVPRLVVRVIHSGRARGVAGRLQAHDGGTIAAADR